MQSAQILSTAAASAVVIAVIAWVQDIRRAQRKNLDHVGFMPWTGIFFCALLAAVVLIAVAAKLWFAG